MLNRKVFYDEIKTSLFFGKFTKQQVDGIERLLTTWEEYYSDYPSEYLAYCLGTCYWETGRTMTPIMERGSKEYFNQYDIQYNPTKAKALGNTQPGDGYKFRGAGDVQNTGRGNALKATKRLNEVFNLNIDLVKNPEKRLDPFISAHSLFLGCIEGWWTGKKLSDFIHPDPGSDYDDFVVSRYTVNGKDQREQIAGFATKFEKAIDKASKSVDIPAILDLSMPLDVREKKAKEEALAQIKTEGKSPIESTTNMAAAAQAVTGVATAFATLDWKVALIVSVACVGFAIWIFKERAAKSYRDGV